MNICSDVLRKRRVLYLGAPARVRSSEASAREVMVETGQNTGNLLIGDAIRRHLSESTEFCAVDDMLHRAGAPRVLPRLARLDTLNPQDIEAEFDVIVIGASNFLNSTSDFSRWAEFLESVHLPCVMIGVGAQASDYGCTIEVLPGTRRLMEVVSERSSSLGVRGDFSATVLQRMGIKNVTVIGCPSMYWACRPTIEVRTKPVTGARLRISVNGSANVVAHAVDRVAAQRVEGLLTRLAWANDYPYVLQNEVELMAILEEGPGSLDSELVAKLIRRYGMTNLSEDEFIGFVRRNMRMYSDLESWASAMRQADFVIGSRFHGCLIGLLSGTPSLLLVHDSRTREMSEFLALPHLDVRDITSLDAPRLYESWNTEAFGSAYQHRYHNYAQFLSNNGLTHCLKNLT